MKARLTVLVGLMALCATGAGAAELRVLAPVVEQGKPAQKADPQGHQVPVLMRVVNGPLFEQLQREATRGFTATVLALDELAQKKSGSTGPGHSWLYLSEEDGGFARTGFWLREGTTERYVREPFVDLVVDEASVAAGDFEEIFAHEMGHVFLRRLFPRLPQGYSRTPHGSLTVTDYPTAFDEGFAIHMQGLVRRLTQNASLRNQDLGLQSKPFVGYWLSNLDRTARIDGVRRNWFVQAQLALPGEGDAVARQDVSTLFDTGRLKNGNQMMAAEGVIATLFYRWLVPGPGDNSALLQRYGALFDALVHLNGQRITPDSPVFLVLLAACDELDAKEGARVRSITVDATYGATADSSLASQFESLARQGRLGDEAFIANLKLARAALAKLQDEVARAPARVAGAMGPDLWVLQASPALSINLNTAEREHFMALPGFDAALAEKALQTRRRDGLFRDLQDFARRLELTPDVTASLAALAHAMEAAGTYPRE